MTHLKKSPSGQTLVWLEGGYAKVKTLMIRIDRKELERLPNANGLVTTFEMTYPNGYEADWTLTEQLRFLDGPMGRFLGHLCEYNVLPRWRLNRQDLSGIDFRLKDLRGFDLSESKLPKDLRACDLRQARLFGVEAVGSDFTGCLLSGANLESADLRDTTFVEAALHGTELSRSKLNGSYWRESVLKHVGMRAVDLRYTTFVDCTFEDVDQTDCTLADRPNTYRETEYLYDLLGQPHPQYVEDEVEADPKPDLIVTDQNGDPVPVWFHR